MKMAKGFVDKTRSHIAGVGRVANESAWGEQKATDRYGGDTRHPDMGHGSGNQNKPQKAGDPNNLQGNYYDNDCRNDWKRAAGGTAENRPNYVGGYRAPHGEPGDRTGPPLRDGAQGPHK
jgi:hypothetical protein